MNRYSIIINLIMIWKCIPVFLKDVFSFKCLYVRNLLRRKRWLRVAVFIVAFLTMYIFGVFTHIFEKDLAEFKTEVEPSVRQTLESLGPKPNIELIPDTNNLNYTFIYAAKDFCKPVSVSTGDGQVSSQPYLVILVKSKISHFRRRDVIRKTWGQSDRHKLIRTVFLIGSMDFTGSSDEYTKEEKRVYFHQLTRENSQYQDIVQQEFIDNYYNNTLKTMMGIKWINRYCINSKYFLFIDDDFYLNPNQLMKYLKDDITTDVYNQGLYGGFVFPNSSPMRHYISKWYISIDEYPYHKFPPFVAAGCYMLSRPSAQLFYLGSRMIKKFRFDDVYMGILAQNIDIKARHIERVNYYAPSYDPDLYATEVIAAHDFSPDKLEDMWKELHSLIEFDSMTNYKIYI